MATILRCDGCDVTVESHEARHWQALRVSCEGVRKYYDLCPKCFNRAVFAIRSERNTTLTAQEQELLRQIWRNAEAFDQSVGDVEPWHGKAGSGPHA